MNADGTDVTNLTNVEGGDLEPAWSPDGSRIVFRSRRPDQTYFGWRDIYVMNADGSGVTNLTDAEGNENSPAWSPDGSRIAFVSDRDGNREIYAMVVPGS